MKVCKIVIVCLLLLCAGQGMAVNVENGVSWELARYRAAHLSGIRYEIAFSIPDDRSENVTFEETILFDYQGGDDLQIDFQGKDLDPVGKVNGKKFPLSVSHEHLVLPKRLLRKGRNIVQLSGISADQSLNRNVDYLYTLFVPAHARSVFACFDQPDLKARFSLSLTMPSDWVAISNAPVLHQKSKKEKHLPAYLKKVRFEESDLLPTYLFSFTAGKFQRQVAERDGRQLEALYRETDSLKVAQMDKVFDEIALSLGWLEKYTGIAYPFKKYGFVVLPGYQFGGMEHPGAIQFRDKSIFLGKDPTPDEELNRLELIAHETTHMWFGDLVTMRWFNDVWTKEVFANLLADKISKEQFPQINHDLNFLKVYQTRALATDRTDGTHPIQQSLDNLNNAGLLYGNIIYDKAPVMMRKLEQQMGQEAFQQGLQHYLRSYAYSNATWDDLIAILDSIQPHANLKAFSHVWVKEKGMPTITCRYKDGKIFVDQTDPFRRGLVWRQEFKIGCVYDGTLAELTDQVEQAHEELPFAMYPQQLYLNYDGSGYGRFLITEPEQKDAFHDWYDLPETNRFAAMMNIYENYLAHKLSAKETFHDLMDGLRKERNDLIASTCIDYLMRVKFDMEGAAQRDAEIYMMDCAYDHPLKSVRLKMLRNMGTTAVDPEVLDSIYGIWKGQKDSLLTVNDYNAIAYHLSLMMPSQWKQILEVQRARLKNEDQQREFDYISRGCNPDVEVQKQLFYGLLQKENRRIEPWARSLLALLCDNVREPYNNAYLKPGLDALQDIQQTSDIFFPGYWLSALLSGHKSQEAKERVRAWIDTHPDYPATLMNKLKENAYYLLNR